MNQHSFVDRERGLQFLTDRYRSGLPDPVRRAARGTDDVPSPIPAVRGLLNVTITSRVTFELSPVDAPPLKADLRFSLELLHQPDCRVLVRDKFRGYSSRVAC
jgi:hypothetical protein